MRVDALAVQLRPRLMLEATDLGVRLVQAHARSVYGTFVPLYAVVALMALCTIELGSWVPGLIVFWLKPWLDRSLLFVLSRAVFGESTRFIDLWRARSAVWWSQLPSTLTRRRLSPWRSYTQPILQLEGQRGAQRRARRAQILAGRGGAALAMHVGFVHVELALYLACLVLAYWFTPPELRDDLMRWFNQDGDNLWTALASSVPYLGVILLLEPFYVAAGFAMYLNRRVELEAWDVEQELRRAFLR